MRKLINELMDIKNEGYEMALLCWNKDFSRISAYLPWNIKAIPKEYLIGTIDLWVYDTEEDMIEEINNMLEEA